MFEDGAQENREGVDGVTRRTFVSRSVAAGATVAGAATILSACGGSSSSSGVTPSGVLGELARGTPKRGGTFTVGVISGGQEENLFPGTSVGTPDFVRDYTLYNLLFYLGKKVSPLEPGLALSAEPNKGATVWTFKLRSGVTWHDGKQFGADDVVYNFKALWSNPEANFSAGFLSGMVDFKNVRKRDNLTVEVPLNYAVAEFPTIFAYFDFPVVQNGATAQTTAHHPPSPATSTYASFPPSRPTACTCYT